MSLNQKTYFRKVYGALDYLADLGGLFSSCSGFCRAILGLFNFYGGYQFLMSDLFESESKKKARQKSGRANSIHSTN